MAEAVGSTDRSLMMMAMMLVATIMPNMPNVKGGAPNSKFSRHHDVHPALAKRRKKKG